MIGCYLFVKIRRNQCISVLETERVVKIISERGQPSIIKEDEINVLKRIEGLEVEIENCSANLHPGDKVAIRKGNLAGLQGRLIRQNGKKFYSRVGKCRHNTTTQHRYRNVIKNQFSQSINGLNCNRLEIIFPLGSAT